MNFTYNNWKGGATTYAYPSNQPHFTKYDTCVNLPGKPNPIKQWRKQLSPYVSLNTVQSHPTIQDIEGSIKTEPAVNLSVIYEDVVHLNKCKGVESSPCKTGSFAVRRSANTIINKKFCWNSKQYLQSRCKTYDQNNQIGSNVEGTEFLSGACVNDCKNKHVIYNPNNKEFSCQGGVSSSSRIAKLKYDTIRNSQNTYDSLLANLDSSTHILNRKPTPCVQWKIKGKRPYTTSTSVCVNTNSLNNI
uniref:Uncharacterized protein n=1 Tax=viral metagenome TaxID=1070528 RepID=A0A6C0EVD5_9ZZZZ